MRSWEILQNQNISSNAGYTKHDLFYIKKNSMLRLHFPELPSIKEMRI